MDWERVEDLGRVEGGVGTKGAGERWLKRSMLGHGVWLYSMIGGREKRRRKRADTGFCKVVGRG